MKMTSYFFIVALLIIGPTVWGKAPSAAELLENWKNAMYTDHEVSKMRLIIKRKAKDEIVRDAHLNYSSKNEKRRIYLQFFSPANIKGTAFLSIKEDKLESSDQWIYFPAYKKARRLSSRKKDDSFLDSDFSNGDISFEYLRDYKFTVTGDDVIDAAPSYVLEGVPEKKSSSFYSKQKLYISKATKLAAKCEFFNSDSKLFKILQVEKWTKYGDRWAIDRAVMKNLLEGSETVIEFINRDPRAIPADKVFTLSHLERGY